MIILARLQSVPKNWLKSKKKNNNQIQEKWIPYETSVYTKNVMKRII